MELENRCFACGGVLKLERASVEDHGNRLVLLHVPCKTCREVARMRGVASEAGKVRVEKVVVADEIALSEAFEVMQARINFEAADPKLMDEQTIVVNGESMSPNEFIKRYPEHADGK